MRTNPTMENEDSQSDHSISFKTNQMNEEHSMDLFKLVKQTTEDFNESTENRSKTTASKMIDLWSELVQGEEANASSSSSLLLFMTDWG